MTTATNGAATPSTSRRSAWRALLLCGALLPGPALAQVAVSGTGGGPETTITAPHTSSVGQTVPPGAAHAPTADPTERTERQRRLDRVMGGVCDRC